MESSMTKLDYDAKRVANIYMELLAYVVCSHAIHPVMLAPMLVIGCGWIAINMEGMQRELME